MNIKVPTKYKELNLTDNEAMLVALMLMIAEENGYEHQYYIHDHDLRKILKTTTLSPTGYKLNNLKNIFEFGKWNDENWCIQFNEGRDAFYGRKRLQLYKHKLKSVRNQQLWCYLLGMFRGGLGGELIETTTEHFPHIPVQHGTMMSRLQEDNFRIEDTIGGLSKT